MSITAYSHLESLLLFQALRFEGVQSISFNRISDQLKSLPLVRNDPSYDSGRLSPDALRELYLGLLKEEVKRDLDNQAHHTQQDRHARLVNGDASSPASRKRKAPSPTLPTVHDAAQHAHLIPQLVARLYARYRENTVTNIKSYEARYAESERHVKEIEHGQWDERLQRDDGLRTQPTVSQTQSPRPSPKPSSTAHTQPVLARPDLPKPPPASTGPLTTTHPTATNMTGVPKPKPYSQAKIDAMINHGPDSQNSPGDHRRASSSTKLPPLSEMAPQSPHYGVSSNVPGQGHQSMHPMPPAAPNHVYNQTPPAVHQSPYASHHAHPRSGSVSSPQIQQSLSRPSSSPRPILPPPPGMPMSPHTSQHAASPVQHQYPQHMTPQPQYHHPPQHRVSSGPQQQVYPAPPHTPGYYPPQQQQHYQDRRTSYPQHPQTPTYQQQSPHLQPHPGQVPQGGYMQPYQVPPQDQHRPILPQQPRPLQAQMPVQGPPTYPQHPYNGPATGPRPPPVPNRMVLDVIALLATPPRTKVRPLWKEKYQPSPLVPSAEKPRPVAEPLSPRQERKSPARTTRATRGRVPSIEEPLQAEPASKTRTSKRKASARERSPGGHSVVSSAADESLRGPTRSQSVSTAAGAHANSDERPSSRNGVKMEPSTPAENLEPTEHPASASGPVTRKRRGTLQSQPLPPSKRRRHESPILAHEAEATPPPKGTTVVATKNFNKMTSALMNDILSHKHASYFAGPVRDKDAPGYSDIVLHPQNLKAIKAAMTAGNQAVKAAASLLESPSETTGPSSGTVELERSADLEPPKAIVNAAQLEKELMRMFANAYLFNPGEDGMALTTKEMFLDVEQKLSEWRGADRSVGDEEEDGKGKRRK